MSENGASEAVPDAQKEVCQQSEVPKMSENGDEVMSDLEKKVSQQIEYYFGDHNLPRDKFLKEQVKLDDGWVSLETMIKFNRLSSLTTDFNVIIEALRKSKTTLLEISEDKTKIRRSPDKPLPEFNEQYKEALKKRSVYVKGFLAETTLDEVKEWLEDKGKVENIQMRRNAQKQFKGSIFAVFDSADSAKKFVETPDMKYKDNDLLVLFKSDYFAKKFEEKKKLQLEAKSKAKQEKEEKEKEAENAEMKSLDEKTGCLLKFSGELDDKTSREDLHELFASHGEIKWIDFSRGAKNGIILFKENAKEALEKAKKAHGGNLKLKNKDVTWEMVEGDEEKEALKKMMEDQQESLNKKKGRGRRPKGKGGKGQAGQGQVPFQGKKTKFESDDEGDEAAAPASPKKRALEETEAEEPASKLQKTENGSGDQ